MTTATAIVTILGGLPVRADVVSGEVQSLSWLKGREVSQCIYDKLPYGWQDDIIQQVRDRLEPWELRDVEV